MSVKKPKLIDSGPILAATGLVHRVQVPDGSGPYPTVVMLHGRSGDEDVMWVFARTIPANCLIISVRAIEAEGNSYSWHPPGNGWPDLADFELAVTAVTRFIQALPAQYNANADAIYLMGFSQGAAAAYATALHWPGLVKGIAGLVGFMPLGVEDAIRGAPLADLPVLMLVGKEDTTIPLHIARTCAKMLRAAGAYLEYREYDTGHKLNSGGMQKLKNWWASLLGAEN